MAIGYWLCVKDGEPLLDSVLVHMGSMYSTLGKFEKSMSAYRRAVSNMENIYDRQGMAEAGAQTAWQRRANCCFVQEDSGSAPRFSSYPSSSSSKAESDIAPENIKPDCMPYNPSPELAPNTKWWLNLEPNCGPQEEFTYEQLKVLEAELEVLNSAFVHKTPIISNYYLIL